MTDSRFQALLWTYIALIAAGIASGFLAVYPPSIVDAYEAAPEPRLMRDDWLAIGILAALVVPWLVGLVGLFRYKRWARTLSLVSTVVALLIYPHLGITILSGVEFALAEAAATVWGAILAVAYFSPVSDRFAGANKSFEGMPLRGTP